MTAAAALASRASCDSDAAIKVARFMRLPAARPQPS
jgi:hypothetical protein